MLAKLKKKMCTVYNRDLRSERHGLYSKEMVPQIDQSIITIQNYTFEL